MLRDDPRHGTEAGYGAHRRAGEPACDPCYQGRLRGDRRRRKLRTLGRSRRHIVGDSLYRRIKELSERHSQTQVAEWADVQPTVIHRIIQQGPTARLDATNKVKLIGLRPKPIVTPIGYTRRLRALMAWGYSAPQIAAAVGLDKETVKSSLVRPPVVVKRESRRKMLEAFDRLSVQPPPVGTRFERAQVTRAKNRARLEGWQTAFAWNDIDDINEQPKHNVRGTKDPAELQSRLDMAVVWRLVDDGARVRKLSGAEAREAWRILVGRGLSTHEIEKRYGLNSERYGERVA